MSGWTRGREEILGMIERQELTQVTANEELADRLITTARQHLASARMLAGSDPYLAYAGLYDAQFGASMGAILRPVDRIRTTRHEAEYPGRATYIDQDSVMDDLPKAEAVVEAATKAMPHLSPFTG